MEAMPNSRDRAGKRAGKVARGTDPMVAGSKTWGLCRADQRGSPGEIVAKGVG